MIVRALDANHDWTFGKGRQNYKSGQDAIMQLIDTRLYSFLGDCFFAIGDCIDWFTYLSGKDPISLQLAVKATILNTTGVTGIVSFSTDFDPLTRKMSMQYTVNTIYTGTSIQTAVSAQGQTSFLLTEDGLILLTESGQGIEAG